MSPTPGLLMLLSEHGPNHSPLFSSVTGLPTACPPSHSPGRPSRLDHCPHELFTRHHSDLEPEGQALICSVFLLDLGTLHSLCLAHIPVSPPLTVPAPMLCLVSRGHFAPHSSMNTWNGDIFSISSNQLNETARLFQAGGRGQHGYSAGGRSALYL